MQENLNSRTSQELCNPKNDCRKSFNLVSNPETRSVRLSRLRIPSSLVLVLHCTEDTMLLFICQELLTEIEGFGRDYIHNCCDVRAILM